MKGMNGSALFVGAYRYRLGRAWGEGPTLLAVLLNGATADATHDDNTVSRVVKGAQLRGYGRLWLGNCFGLMAQHPSALYSSVDPVGPDCDEHLRWMAASSDDVLIGWGSFPKLAWRFWEVLRLLGPRRLMCLGRTLDGSPRHPARLAASTPWEVWREASVAA
jgi:hypothetical protein